MTASAQIEVSRWNPHSSQGFNAASIVPPRVDSDDVVVYPMSYDYRIEPLVLRRLEVVAIVTRRRLVAVETPGITMDTERPGATRRASVPLRAQWRALLGDFTALADLQRRALDETFGVDTSRYRLLGESLGAQSVMSMPRSITPRSIDLIEPVNCQRRSMPEMMRIARALSGREAELRVRYVQRSRDAGWAIPAIFEVSSTENGAADRRLKRFWNQGRFAVLSALALSGGLAREIPHIAASTPVRVWRGADSTACNEEHAESFLSQLTASGSSTELISLSLPDVPSGHHVLTDLNAATGFALELRRRWS